MSFTPAVNGYGTATIIVTVNDSQSVNSSRTQTFTVTVNHINQTPTLSPLGNLTLNENDGQQTVNLSGITTGATNEADTLVVTATSSNPALIPTPSVAYTSPNAAGTLTFIPAHNGFGSATITVTVNDGQSANNSVTQTFTVTVNHINQAPTLDPIGNLSVNENAGAQTVGLSGITTGATNEAEALTVTAVSSNPALIPDPSVTYTGGNTIGNLTLTPAVNGFGSSTITVTVNDGQAANNTVVRTFTVSVGHINQAPTLGTIGNIAINENAGAQTVNLSGITSGATNEADTLVVTAVSSNPALIPNPSVVYASPNSGGNLTVTPAANNFGTATITITVNDGQSQNNTATRTFTVTVNHINQPPTLTAPGNISINENSGIQTINLSGISSGATNEPDVLIVKATSSNPSLIPAPTVSYTSPNAAGTLTIVPAPNASGNATITVTVDDGQSQNNLLTRTFVVTVNPFNAAPTLDPIADVAMNENGASQTVNLTGISTGATNESQTLTVTAVSSNPALIPNPAIAYTSPSGSGSLTLAPAPDAYGTATITVTVNDGQPQNNRVTRTFTVTVAHINQPPTLDPIASMTVRENAAPQLINLTGITSGATNEPDTLTVTATSSNPGLIPNPIIGYASPASAGTLTFAPAFNQTGSSTITVTVNDGQAQNSLITQTFTVTVALTNQSPILNPIGDLTLNENAGLQTVNLAGIITGLTNNFQNFTITASSSNPRLVPAPKVNYTSPNENATITFAPAANLFGLTTISVTANNGRPQNNLSVQTFKVVINPFNVAPSLNPIGTMTLPENAGPAIRDADGHHLGRHQRVAESRRYRHVQQSHAHSQLARGLHQPIHHGNPDLHPIPEFVGPRGPQCHRGRRAGSQQPHYAQPGYQRGSAELPADTRSHRQCHDGRKFRRADGEPHRNKLWRGRRGPAAHCQRGIEQSGFDSNSNGQLHQPERHRHADVRGSDECVRQCDDYCLGQ